MEENVFELMTPEEAIRFLSKNLGPEWQTVGRHLGPSDAELSRIQMDYDGYTKEKIYQMLLRWKSKKGHRATVPVLAKALSFSERQDLADALIHVSNPAATLNTRREESTTPNRQTNARDPGQPQFEKYRSKVFCIILGVVILIPAIYFGQHAYNKNGSTEESDELAKDNVIEHNELETPIKVIAKRLTKDEWKDVGRNLGLLDPEIDHIGEEYDRSSSERNYQMLQKWKKKFGSHATLGVLEEALEKANRRDLVDKIRKDS